MAGCVVNKRALLIAYHFPPMAVSSGLQRTLKFSRYLPDLGWQCAVLTAHERAYERTDPGQMADIRDDVQVNRAFAIDTARHLRICGRYPRLLALPDRWVSWLLGAVPGGLAMIRKHRPDVLWTTYPIATAHIAGLLLSRLSGVPLVADYRDSMTEPGYPTDPLLRRIYTAIESRVVRHAACCVFTTPGARRAYQERYPDVQASRLRLIENAFDEENFRSAALLDVTIEPDRPFTMAHSGVVYPSERDPGPLFRALGRLKRAGRIDASGFRLVLRATGHDPLYAPMLAEQAIEDLVDLAPPLPYAQALREMLDADALLLMQAANCNHQIPAKLYEYVRAGRPVFSLTDPTGDTAATLMRCGLAPVVPLDDEEAIVRELPAFIDGVRAGAIKGASRETAAQNTREARAVELAALLDEVVDRR